MPPSKATAASKPLTYKDCLGENEAELVLAYQAGNNAAGSTLCKVHRGYILTVSKGYLWTGFDLEDLEGYANVGFTIAMQRWKKDKGVKLTTYASYWIWATIMRAFTNDGNLIHLPQRLRTAIWRAKAKGFTLDDAIADGMITPTMAKAVAPHWNSGHVSLDAPQGESGDRTLNDMIGDDAAVDADDLVERIAHRADAAALNAALASLKPRDAFIVRQMFGAEPRTLQSVGDDLKITRERVRQLLARTLTALEGMVRPAGENPTVDEPEPIAVEPPPAAQYTSITTLTWFTWPPARPVRHVVKRAPRPTVIVVKRQPTMQQLVLVGVE